MNNNDSCIEKYKARCKEDLEDFKAIVKEIAVKVEDKDGKLVNFSDAAKKHISERVAEHTLYNIKK